MSDPRHPAAVAPIAERVRALEEALTERRLIPDGYLESSAERIQELSPRNGARVVARAWVDPEYRARLLADAAAAIAELGFRAPGNEYLVVLENTPSVHNAIVCTQCSCTAWSVLGLPPDWYKSPEYRSRIVREPRALLRTMGLELPEHVAVRVWDTTGESRYMVLPLRPAGTEDWTEAQLAEIVTREAMIGVARCHPEPIAPAT
ncbi:MAG: nitrile hydratase subunit alpha [Candidatus Binatia bacterium]